MEQIDQKEKTLVFCATQDHALAVRDLINQMKTSTDPNYCQRVTANDGELGNQYLRDFQDNEKTIPTILTTSQKLSTGVDARNIRNIVLMRPINTMIEFKQIIGRGTRLYDGKDYFTIYDFVKAYRHFSDPEWDGEPLEPEPCKMWPYPCQCVKRAAPCRVRQRTCECPKSLRVAAAPCAEDEVKVKLADGKERAIQHMMATTFWHPDGTPMSAQQFMEICSASCPSSSRTRPSCALCGARPERGRSCCRDSRRRVLATSSWPRCRRSSMPRRATSSTCWRICRLRPADAHPRRTRRARAKVAISAHFNSKQQAFLDFVLAHYVEVGVDELDQEKLTPLLRLKYHDSIADAIADLGKPEEISKVFVGFQKYLYQQAA